MTVMILSFTGGAGLKTGCHTRDNYWAILPDFEKKQPQKGSGRRASISKGKGRAKSVMVRNNDLQKAYEDIENKKKRNFHISSSSVKQPCRTQSDQTRSIKMDRRGSCRQLSHSSWLAAVY